MLRIQNIFNLITGSKKFGVLENRILSRSNHEFNFDSEEEIITNTLGQVMLIGMNLPNTKNLLTETALKKLGSCINSFDSNDNFSVAILHGCGGNFCTGTVPTIEAKELSQNLIKMFPSVKKPIIGALNGYTTNFGFFLAVMCDIRAMEYSSLAGLGYKTHEMEILPIIYERLLLNMGLARTTELICTQHVWPASQFLSAGFISIIVDHGCSLGQAISWAQSMAFNIPLKNIIQRKSEILSYLTAKV